MGLFKERDRKRHEDDEGDVIREYHGGKEGEKEEYLPHPPAIQGLLKEMAEKAAEESGASKSCYDGHERKRSARSGKLILSLSEERLISEKHAVTSARSIAAARSGFRLIRLIIGSFRMGTWGCCLILLTGYALTQL